MKMSYCLQEEAVTRAARSGEWEESLREHARACEVCREIAGTAGWMQAMTKTIESEVDSRDASLIWRRSQLAEKRERKERAERAVAWTEIVSLAILAAGFAVWLALDWQQLQEAGAWLAGVLAPETWTATYSVDGLVQLPLWLIVILLSLAGVFLAYPALIED